MITCPYCGSVDKFNYVFINTIVFQVDLYNNLEIIENTERTQKVDTGIIVCKNCTHTVKLNDEQKEQYEHKLKYLEKLALEEERRIL